MALPLTVIAFTLAAFLNKDSVSWPRLLAGATITLALAIAARVIAPNGGIGVLLGGLFLIWLRREERAVSRQAMHQREL